MDTIFSGRRPGGCRRVDRRDDRVVDGRVLRTQPAIHYTEPPVLGIGPAAARRLAAELLNAADTLDDGRRQLDDLGEHRR